MNEELIGQCAAEVAFPDTGELAIHLCHARAVAPLVEAAQKAERILASHGYETDYLRKALAPFQQENSNVELTFHPISTAPLDGTEVWLRNSMLGRPVKGRYTDYTSPWGSVSKQWVLTDDPLGELIGIPAGTRIIPDEWASAETETHGPKGEQ